MNLATLVVALVGLLSFGLALGSSRLDPAQPSLAFLKNSRVVTLLAALYFWGLPYLLLLTGLIPARLFGLRGLEFFTIPGGDPGLIFNQISSGFLTWLPDLEPWLGSGAMGIVGLGFYLWLYLQAVKPEWPPPEALIYHSKLELLYDIAHWAFYRAIFWLILNDLYLGVLAGSLLILLEYLTLARLGVVTELWRQQHLFRFGLGFMAAMVFFFAPNLWLVALLHLFLVVVTENIFKIAAGLKTAAP